MLLLLLDGKCSCVARHVTNCKAFAHRGIVLLTFDEAKAYETGTATVAMATSLIIIAAQPTDRDNFSSRVKLSSGSLNTFHPQHRNIVH